MADTNVNTPLKENYKNLHTNCKKLRHATNLKYIKNLPVQASKVFSLMLLIDAHVHIYDFFNLDDFFNTTYFNMKSVVKKLGAGSKFIGILLLAETSKDHWFDYLASSAGSKDTSDCKQTESWTFYSTGEDCSLYACSGGSKSLIIIAGHQIVTAEGLELISILSRDKYQDGDTLPKLVEKVSKRGGISVVPWGFGKWSGKRGQILESFLEDVNDSKIFLGDNSGRPYFLPRPWLFQKAEAKGIHVLPGSDPLPVSEGYKRTGSFGFIINKSLPDQNLSQFIKNELILHPQGIRPYGKRDGLFSFIRNQIAVRVRGR